MKRYTMTYGELHGSIYAYVVVDDVTKRVTFSSNSKPEAIAKAQKLNGFTPIDGSESTYARQCGLAGDTQP